MPEGRPYLETQTLVNQNLIKLGILPQEYQLNAKNISDLIRLIQGFAEIRKNARVLSQPVKISSNTNALFNKIPSGLKAKIAGFTGNDSQDETCIARILFKH